MLLCDGLQPPSIGARVQFKDGRPKVTDGPFAQANETLVGYWSIQAKSSDEAIE